MNCANKSGVRKRARAKPLGRTCLNIGYEAQVVKIQMAVNFDPY